MRHWPAHNVNKTEYIGFKQKGAISTLKDKLLKFVNQFTYINGK